MKPDVTDPVAAQCAGRREPDKMTGYGTGAWPPPARRGCRCTEDGSQCSRSNAGLGASGSRQDGFVTQWRGMRGTRMSDDDRRLPPLKGALVRLGICFVVALLPLLGLFGMPRRNAWWRGEILSATAILAGAYWAGWRCFHPLLFFVYGLLGGLIVAIVLVLDIRGFSPIGFAAVYWACVVAFGLTCRSFGKTGSEDAEQSRRRRGRDAPKCEGCGYLLYGLAQNRCPECGRPFNRPRESPPAGLPPTQAGDR